MSERISKRKEPPQVPLKNSNKSLAKQWHPTMNGELTAADVAQSDRISVYWQCPENSDHVWKAAVDSRAYNHTGCPYCAGKKVDRTNSLASCSPEMAACWHPTKNGTLSPDKVTTYSNKSVWWQCPDKEDHVWEAKVNNVAHAIGTGCPFCAAEGRQGRILKDSLLQRDKKLAKQWHPTLNGELTPADIGAGNSRRVYWQCPVDREHVWQASISIRVLEKTGCPFCSNKKIIKSNSLAAWSKEVASRWHPTKNGALNPEQVAPMSSRRVWWRCDIDESHEWESSVSQVAGSSASGCPFCQGLRICENNSLQTLAPKIAKEWHERNNPLKASDVSLASGKRVWWRCALNPEHEWQAMICNRTLKGQGCPHESRLSDHYPEIAREWHSTKNGKLKPEEVTWGSPKVVWWMCPNKHAWQASIYDRTREGRECQVCLTLKVKYPIVAKLWHPTRNGTLSPHDVKAGSKKKCWWKCAAGHVYYKIVKDMVRSYLLYGTNGCLRCFELSRVHKDNSPKRRLRKQQQTYASDQQHDEEDERASRLSKDRLS